MTEDNQCGCGQKESVAKESVIEPHPPGSQPAEEKARLIKNIIYEVATESIEKSYEHCSCKSNRKHFVSAKHFAHNDHPFHTEDHKVAKNYLPKPYNRRSVYDLILYLFHLTVLVRRSGKITSSASGRIIAVSDLDDAVYIQTACHHVSHALPSDISCRMDYDRKNCPEINLPACEFVFVNDVHDICVLRCTVADKVCKDKIKARLDKFNELCRAQFEKMKKREKLYGQVSLSEWALSTLVVVVSHPHGGPKRISIGKRVQGGVCDAQPKRDHLMTYMYSSATCHGSSGAPVLIFGSPECEIFFLHRGKLENVNVNVSSVAFTQMKTSDGLYRYKVFDRTLS